MWIQDEISSTIQQHSVRAVELSKEECDAMFAALERKFAESGGSPLWERLISSTGIRNASAWQRIPDLVSGSLFLLAEDSQGKCGYRFDKANDVVTVLAECSGFEFYITDLAMTYLLAFNSHDVLVGVGDAATWVRKLQLE